MRCSAASPASKSPLAPEETAASTHRTMQSGASKPRVRRAIEARNAANCSAPKPSRRSLRSRMRGRGMLSATARRANATAPDSRSASESPTISLIRPHSSASAAPMGLPLTMISSARCGPVMRGKRCVPPPPGSRPSFTSGRPNWAELMATRKCAHSATSSPPPSAVPWIAATTGLLQFSMASWPGTRPGGFGGWENSVMSAPAMNVRPSQISTMAAASLASAAAMPSMRPWRT